MSVKEDFVLLVVYLLVPLACNFAQKTICQQIGSVAWLTLVELEIHLKEGGKRNFKRKYDVKVKSLKWQLTLVGIFSYVEEEII